METKHVAISMMLVFLIVFLTACGVVETSSQSIDVTVSADGMTQEITVDAGTSAREALELLGIEIGTLDKSDPPLYTVLQDDDVISLTRVIEEYSVEQVVIPYDTQILQNESLAEGEQRLIQPGENGIEEITYRILFEDDVEVSRTVSSNAIIEPAVSEIVMVGSQTPFSVLDIPGILAYISAGNAWVMRENTGFRQPVVTTGDLDGRVFSISPNGRWLLYTRSGDGEEEINSLWVTNIDSDEDISYDMGIRNVIHFADWIPGSNTGIVYSTAEVSASAPGWEANNDLAFLNFSEESGWTSSPREAVSENLGGLYGWWGTEFEYSVDGEQLLYSRPDGFGLVDTDTGRMTQLYTVLSVQTRSDWAWVPPVSWSQNGQFIYFVDHVQQEGVTIGEDSVLFDLAVYPFGAGAPVSIVEEVGMFAWPSPSPVYVLPSGEQTFSVAFLQAVSPRQSRTSTYELMVMDRDGSNLRRIYTQEGGQELTPHQYYWLPWYAVNDYPLYIAYIYQGNLWLIDSETGEAQQLTGDGLVSAIDWN